MPRAPLTTKGAGGAPLPCHKGDGGGLATRIGTSPRATRWGTSPPFHKMGGGRVAHPLSLIVTFSQGRKGHNVCRGGDSLPSPKQGGRASSRPSGHIFPRPENLHLPESRQFQGLLTVYVREPDDVVNHPVRVCTATTAGIYWTLAHRSIAPNTPLLLLSPPPQQKRLFFLFILPGD